MLHEEQTLVLNMLIEIGPSLYLLVHINNTD